MIVVESWEQVAADGSALETVVGEIDFVVVRSFADGSLRICLQQMEAGQVGQSDKSHSVMLAVEDVAAE